MFLKYAAARLNEKLETAAFRCYLADSLWMISRGQIWDERWRNIIKPQKPVKDADPDEIKTRITKGLKGLAKA